MIKTSSFLLFIFMFLANVSFACHKQCGKCMKHERHMARVEAKKCGSSSSCCSKGDSWSKSDSKCCDKGSSMKSESKCCGSSHKAKHSCDGCYGKADDRRIYGHEKCCGELDGTCEMDGRFCYQEHL